MTNSIYSKTTLRFYINPHYGSQSGPRALRRALYRGSVEFPEIGIKAWVDFPMIDQCQFAFDHHGYVMWQSAMWELAKDLDYTTGKESDFCAGQLIGSTQPKEYLNGIVVANMQKQQLLVVADFDGSNNLFCAKLNITHCFNKDPSKKAPDLIATNCELPSVGSEVKSSSTMRANPMSMVNKLRATAV